MDWRDDAGERERERVPEEELDVWRAGAEIMAHAVARVTDGWQKMQKIPRRFQRNAYGLMH